MNNHSFHYYCYYWKLLIKYKKIIIPWLFALKNTDAFATSAKKILSIESKPTPLL